MHKVTLVYMHVSYMHKKFGELYWSYCKLQQNPVKHNKVGILLKKNKLRDCS